MPSIHTPESLKGVREALCRVQVLMGAVAHPDVMQALKDSTTINHLIEGIDAQRPLGDDGTHGDNHTPTCGCEDHDVDTYPMPQMLVRPLMIELTKAGVQEVWDTFVKPKQDAGELQSIEDRALMAILRSAYIAAPEGEQKDFG